MEYTYDDLGFILQLIGTVSFAVSGALTWVALHYCWNDTAAMLIGGSLIVGIRLLAAHFRWSLPKAKDKELL